MATPNHCLLLVALVVLQLEARDEPRSPGWERLADFFRAQEGWPGMLGSSNITRTKVRMSDGAELTTTVLDLSPQSGRRPTVIARSPYGKLSSTLATLFANKGHVAVMQDDRGTITSGGTFDMFRMANDDGLRTMEWIIAQPWSNGEVYSVGVSADGIGEIAMMLQKPTMLRGQWWAWATGNGHGFAFPGGVYRQDMVESYMHTMSLFTRGASVNHVIPELRANERWSQWWSNLTICREPSPCHWNNVNFPVVTTAGWWDIFSQSQLAEWEGLRKRSDPSVRDKHVLVVGPLGHCAMDPLQDARSTMVLETGSSLTVSADVAGEFFAGSFDGPVRSRIGRVNLFVMKNFADPAGWWTSLDELPIPSMRTLYLHSGGALDTITEPVDGSRTYSYDPSKPTPMVGGRNIPFVCKTGGWCGAADQLARERRSDVLVFESPPLGEELAIVGRVQARLFVASSANDTDFVVTVSDLKPGILGTSLGKKSMMVRYGAVRMRWREGDVVPSAPLSPEKIYEVEVDLTHVAYVFPKGHQIRVAISSAAAPYYNVNPNTGRFTPEGADSSEIALNVIHTGLTHPSSISLPVVDALDIPPNRHFSRKSLVTSPQVIV